MTTSTLGEVRNIKLGSYWYKAEFQPEVNNVLRRLHEGDATLGWLGDDTLSIHLVVESDRLGRPLKGGQQMWEVWGQNPDGSPYACLKWPRCDESLLKALAERDTRTEHIRKRFELEVMQQEQRRADARREKFEELADKAQWALKKDTGHLEGGTHRLTTVDGFKDAK